METPKHNEIIERARELWHEDRSRSGDPSFAIEPELCELQEDGFIAAAQSDLMRSLETKNREWIEPKTKEKEKTEPENFDDILDVNALLRSGTVIFGGSGCGKTILAKAIVRKLGQSGITCYVLDPGRSWNDQGFQTVQVSTKCSAYGWQSTNTVFDLARLSMNEKMRFVDAFARALLESHMNGSTKANEILVLEEAELYACNNSLRARSLQNVLSLVSCGRNFGLRFIGITQAPAYLDKLVIRLCEQRFFGRLSEPNDMAYCRKLLDKETATELKTLRVGEFFSENKGRIQRFKLDLDQRQERASFNYSFDSGVPLLGCR